MSVAMRHIPPRVRPRRVFLAIPSYEKPSAALTFSLFTVQLELNAAGFDVELALLHGDCHVDDARNALVADFMATDCGDLVFIDADVGFNSLDLIRQLNYDRDIVGGVYPKKSDIPTFPCWIKEGETWADKDGLIEVNGFGTGFMRIRRNVLERMWAESEEFRMDGKVMREVFRRMTIDGDRNSGDISFCRRWRDMGGKVFIDPNCDLEHHGDKSWTGTYGSFLRRTRGMACTSGIEQIAAHSETDAVYSELVSEWGNDPWSAGEELLKTCVGVARQVKGPILETGSGLTTLVMAAANPAVIVHALESQKEWGAKLEQAAERLKLTNIKVHHAPLREYPAGNWYSVPRGLPWEDFELVLCDGPPRQEGNRKILWGVMATHDCRPKCILVDDADTEGDSIPAPYKTQIKGQIRKFAVGLK